MALIRYSKIELKDPIRINQRESVPSTIKAAPAFMKV
jgi:hypothetical protein